MPSPFPMNTLIVPLPATFATARSGIPSWLKSALTAKWANLSDRGDPDAGLNTVASVAGSSAAEATSSKL